MPARETVDSTAFNTALNLPFELRLADFQIAMQDVYDFFFDVNTLFNRKGLPRLDDNLRPAIMSGMLSDMMTASMAAHSRSLVQNTYFNGHPDLVVVGRYPNNLATHRTTMRMEPEFWRALDDIAASAHGSRRELVGAVELRPGESRTSALRVHALNHYRSLLQ